MAVAILIGSGVAGVIGRGYGLLVRFVAACLRMSRTGRWSENFSLRWQASILNGTWLRATALAVFLLCALSAFGESPRDEHAVGAAGRATLVVSAAASVSDAFTDIEARFESAHPDTDVAFNFGSSNGLQRQIEAAGGIGVDVFASAGSGPMERLVEQGLVDRRSVRRFAANRLVLICPPGNPGGLGSLDDLLSERVRRVGVGAVDTPVGHYAHQALVDRGLLEKLRPKLVFGVHTRQVLDYAARGEVDAALLYATDAAVAGERVEVAYSVPPEWHEPIRYPMAVLVATDEAERAGAFVAYVTSDEGAAILRAHGFTAPVPGIGEGEGGEWFGASRDVADSGGRWGDILSAVKLSLIAAVSATLFVVPVGTGIGAWLAKRRFRGRELVDALLTLPMVLPPTVTGYYLIIVFGVRSPLGGMLEDKLGIRVVLTLLGACVASAVVAMPLMIKSARAAFESVSREQELASYSLGKGRMVTFFRVSVPLAGGGLIAGAVLSFARAIGEFGATFMLAGMIPGRTMTMPSAIFHAFTNHEDRMAQTLVVILTLLSLAVIYATNRLAAGRRGVVRA